jgi:hypothetical protein
MGEIVLFENFIFDLVTYSIYLIYITKCIWNNLRNTAVNRYVYDKIEQLEEVIV